MDDEKIKAELLKENIDWIRNPATASNFGGVWERQIRSVRNIMAAPMKQHGHSVNDQSLRTLLCELSGSCCQVFRSHRCHYRPVPLLLVKPSSFFPLQETFNERILTAKVAGGAHSILLMISGIDGVKNIFRSYS